MGISLVCDIRAELIFIIYSYSLVSFLHRARRLCVPNGGEVSLSARAEACSGRANESFVLRRGRLHVARKL